jgi:hypothetical protein
MHTFYDYWLLIYNCEAVEDFVCWMEQSRCLQLIVGDSYAYAGED